MQVTRASSIIIRPVYARTAQVGRRARMHVRVDSCCFRCLPTYYIIYLTLPRNFLKDMIDKYA